MIGLRYRLIPYLYSEYMKAALRGEMMFRPLAFDYPDDKYAAQVEDQLLLGNELMLAPVYEQNARGRYVYLPETMKMVRFKEDGTMETEIRPGRTSVHRCGTDRCCIFHASGYADSAGKTWHSVRRTLILSIWSF